MFQEINRNVFIMRNGSFAGIKIYNASLSVYPLCAKWANNKWNSLSFKFHVLGLLFIDTTAHCALQIDQIHKLPISDNRKFIINSISRSTHARTRIHRIAHEYSTLWVLSHNRYVAFQSFYLSCDCCCCTSVREWSCSHDISLMKWKWLFV